MTRRALSRIEAASSADAERTGLVEACAAVAVVAAPNAPNNTLVNERFITLHMITERMNPEAAFSDWELVETFPTRALRFDRGEICYRILRS